MKTSVLHWLGSQLGMPYRQQCDILVGLEVERQVEVRGPSVVANVQQLIVT